jgi:acyl-CoA reductase-like NAD-dependent aldehyde dehydrogenase
MYLLSSPNVFMFFVKKSPIDGKVLAEVRDFDEPAIDQVVDRAQQAFQEWQGLNKQERSRTLNQMAAVLEAHEEELSQLLHVEQGKSVSDARDEVKKGIQQLFRAAELTLTFLWDAERVVGESESHSVVTVQVSHGVCAAILPWNYPVFLALDTTARALLFGNSIIVKPSPHTPLASHRIAEILAEECDMMPDNVFQIVTGYAAGEYLCKHQGVNKVTFIGSTATGQRVLESAASSNMKRVTLEMGGNDPALILPDADIDQAAGGVVAAALANNGQLCVAVKRVYVHESIFDVFVDAVVDKVERKQEEEDLVPMNNEMQYNKVIELIEDAVLHHGKIVTGGIEKPNANVSPFGLYVKPTVIVGLDDETRLVKEEQFGPVIPILVYSDVEEAIARCNKTTFGLGASVWSSDVDRANEIATRMEAGIVWVNEHGGDIMDAPAGGAKMSGMGRTSDWAQADLHAFTETKVIKKAKKLLNFCE